MKLISLIYILILGSGAWARIEIRTLNSVEISLKDRITMADLVEYEPSDQEQSQELENSLNQIVVKNLGGDEGPVIKLHREEILLKYKLAIQSDEKLNKINPILNLTDDVDVRISNEILSKKELERHMLKVLHQKCKTCSYKIEFTSVPQPESPFWSIDYDKTSEKGPFLLSVKDGTKILYVSGKITVTQKIWVTKRPVSMGSSIQIEDLEERNMDITQFRERPLDLAEILGKKSAMILAQDQPLFYSQLQKEYLAYRGQPISGTLSSENMKISLQLQAEENGFLGDLIKVKNMQTQKISLGKIIEKGVVEIQ